jgi:ubiquinone/menaquinone biosynthesis C-methylase UbiE
VARPDYNSIASSYHRTRSYREEAAEPWHLAVARHLQGVVDSVLDVGAGTGIWSVLLRRWFGVLVVGIEPSPGMRAVASRDTSAPGIFYVGGRGEELPLPDRSIGAAWLSTVIHHLADGRACALELSRVLRPGAPVLVRSSFPGRHDEIPHFRFFPEAQALANTFPTVAETTAWFEAADFDYQALERVRYPRAESLAAERDRIARMRHVDSTLAPLTDAAFAAGLARLDAAVAAGGPAPVAGLDLLVFRLRG